jgi:hypothetical protein
MIEIAESGLPRFFYKYVPANTAARILETQALRWSAPTRFNDAFDVARSLDFGYTAEDLRIAFIDEVVDVLCNNRPDPPHGSRDMCKMLHKVRRQVAEGSNTWEAIRTALVATLVIDPMETVQESWSDIIPKFRILCLSTAPDSPQMWAYYADELRGAVLEFEPSNSTSSQFRHMREVRYSDDQPRLFTKQMFAREMLGVTRLGFREHFEEVQRTKGLLWAHEKEWRAVGVAPPDDTTDYTDFLFNTSELRQVLYGPHINDSARGRIDDLISKEPWLHVLSADTSIDHRRREFVFNPRNSC